MSIFIRIYLSFFVCVSLLRIILRSLWHLVFIYRGWFFRSFLTLKKASAEALLISVDLVNVFDRNGSLIALAARLGFDMFHTIKGVMDDSSLIWCHRIKLHIDFGL